MRYEFSNTQLKRYQGISHKVSIFVFIVGLIFFIAGFIYSGLDGLSDYITAFCILLGYAAFILFLFYTEDVKPYKKTENYFFELNEDSCIFSHPDNKKNFLPERYQFKIKDIINMKFRETEGLEEIILTINDPKRMSYVLKIWGFENMSQISNRIQMLTNVNKRK